MKKEDFIRRYGEAAYEKLREQIRSWKAANLEKARASVRTWQTANPDKVLAASHEQSRKGGKYYDRMLVWHRTDLQSERKVIRNKHEKLYHSHKRTVVPSILTQIHHEWILGTANYRGVALVNAEAHRHGVIEVVEVLEGEITLFAE